MRNFKHLAGAAAVALAVGLAGSPANATLVTTGSGPINYNFTNSATGGGVTANLSGTVQLSNFDFSGVDTVSFHIDVANTTTQQGLTTAQWDSIRLTSFGFNTDPNATGVTDTSTVFNTAVNNNQPLPSIGKLDFCAFVNNCAGGSNGGLTHGTGDSFNVTMTFATDITSLDIGIGTTENLGVKWQTGFGSFEFSDAPGGPNPPPPPPPPVPEPASLAIMGSALLGLGLARRLRRKG